MRELSTCPRGRQRRAPAAAAAFLMLVVPLAGCGSGDDDTPPPTTAPQTAQPDAEAEAARQEQLRREEEEARREELERHPPTYAVEPGDHLWGIAGRARAYGDSRFWPLLYDANRDQVRDPDLIFPGQQLDVPREMTEAERERRLWELWRELGE